jgi:hypothetical protein
VKNKFISLTVLLSLLLLNIEVNAQGLSIGAGTVFNLGLSTLRLSGSWNNQGTFDAGSGTVIFDNGSGNQIITNSSGETFYNVIVNKAAGDIQMMNDIMLNGTLTLTNGDLDLNGHKLTLGTSGMLNETEGNTVKGTTGTIVCTALLNNPSSENPHGIGIEITSPAELGNTTIVRGHTAQTNGVNSGIKRYFDIVPSVNTSLNADIVFHYDPSELNEINENELTMFSSANSGSAWTALSGTANPAAHKYVLSGISSLYRLTLASSSVPLPIELKDFNASTGEGKVYLSWKTATEVNNYGFQIERQGEQYSECRTQNTEWEMAGFVNGHGNSNSVLSYSFQDNNPPAGKLQYRIKQLDNNGGFKYYGPLSVEADAIKEYKLLQNSPNPFNPSTAIKFQLPQNTFVTIKVYDQIGREVTTLLDKETTAGSHIVYWNGRDNNGQIVASGIYLYKLTAGPYTETRKMSLLK